MKFIHVNSWTGHRMYYPISRILHITYHPTENVYSMRFEGETTRYSFDSEIAGDLFAFLTDANTTNFFVLTLSKS